MNILSAYRAKSKLNSLEKELLMEKARIWIIDMKIFNIDNQIKNLNHGTGN